MPAVEMYVNGVKRYTAAMSDSENQPQMIMGSLMARSGFAAASFIQNDGLELMRSVPPIELGVGDTLMFKLVESGESDLPIENTVLVDEGCFMDRQITECCVNDLGISIRPADLPTTGFSQF